MKLTKNDIEHIASLARLSVTEEEKTLYAKQLSVVFDYIEMLNEVNTEETPETCQVTGLEDVTREDKAVPCDERIKKQIINNFPEKEGNLLKVKAVFDN